MPTNLFSNPHFIFKVDDINLQMNRELLMRNIFVDVYET